MDLIWITTSYMYSCGFANLSSPSWLISRPCTSRWRFQRRTGIASGFCDRIVTLSLSIVWLLIYLAESGEPAPVRLLFAGWSRMSPVVIWFVVQSTGSFTSMTCWKVCRPWMRLLRSSLVPGLLWCLGGFNLTKFVFSDSRLLPFIPEEYRSNEVKEITAEAFSKALGIHWDVTNDSFFYMSRYCESSLVVTKRVMLKQVSSMYDPLGLISPIVIQGKMLFQEVTQLKKDWNESVSLSSYVSHVVILVVFTCESSWFEIF